MGSSLNRRIAWIYCFDQCQFSNQPYTKETFPTTKYRETGETYIAIIRSKPMVNPRRQDDQIVLDKLDADPLVALAADVEITRPVADVPDLLVLVQVLVEKLRQLGLVQIARHRCGRDRDLVPVLVVTLGGERVDTLQRGHLEVKDADFGEVRGGYLATGVMGDTLVALW